MESVLKSHVTCASSLQRSIVQILDLKRTEIRGENETQIAYLSLGRRRQRAGAPRRELGQRLRRLARLRRTAKTQAVFSGLPKARYSNVERSTTFVVSNNRRRARSIKCGLVAFSQHSPSSHSDRPETASRYEAEIRSALRKTHSVAPAGVGPSIAAFTSSSTSPSEAGVASSASTTPPSPPPWKSTTSEYSRAEPMTTATPSGVPPRIRQMRTSRTRARGTRLHF